MCTAVTYQTKDHYLGRNLDYEFSYDETIVISPRNYLFSFRKEKEIDIHYAMIGMAFVVNDYPLYYDGMNEAGVGIASLNFPDNAYYGEEVKGKNNIAPFEFIPWVLSQCANLDDVRKLLDHINFINLDFNLELPASPLHWIITDKSGSSITVEPLKEGLRVYENPAGVLTNNPTFESHMFTLNNYMSLSIEPPVNRFCKSLNLDAYSRGMGAIGLPGDLSSSSRFVKATFTKMNSVSGDSESESLSQIFHILGSVAQQRGCVAMGNDMYEITLYTSCCNLDKGIYYYNSYENNQISAIDMHRVNLDGSELISYKLIHGQQIFYQN